MDTNARKLAQVILAAAEHDCIEKDFRKPVEEHLIQLAKQLEIDLVPHTEVTLGTSGRADTIYNRFVVEWERPGFIKPSNKATNNTHTIAQVKDYGDSLFWRTREKPGRIVGCCTDGRYFIFVTKPEREWQTTDPIPVDEQSCGRFLDFFRSLQSGVALLPDYLSEDFSAENNRTQQAVKALYRTLQDHMSAPSLQAVFDQWCQFYGAVTEYEQWRVKLANEDALRRMLKAFGIPTERPDLTKFFFATHTFFAILTKLLAYLIVGRYTDLPTPGLEEWKGLPNDKLMAQFKALEKGGPFHAAGIRNFLEGDFFRWYTDFFTPELADRLRDVVERLAQYDPATLDLAPAPTQDLLKKLYHRLVPPHIRKALGEFYTPDWLAQRLLNMLDGGSYRGRPESRLLDPACGSGTFLIMAINAIRRNSVAESMNKQELLQKICHNVVGIDLNPLAVIAARTNYLLALGHLLKHRGKEPLDIPVYLADSIMTPSRGGDSLWGLDRVRVLLSIGKVELPRRLATQDGIAGFTNLLDKHLESGSPTKPDKFMQAAKDNLIKLGVDWDADSDTIRELYTKLHELHSAGRNGMWARIIKNAFAPVFLAPFDYVAGNPPWINWENLPEGYRTETKDLWVEHKLFVHKGMDTILGKGKKDISTLMTYVAADAYLKDGGKLGFVITQSVLKTGGAGQGFRRFETRNGDPLAVIWVDDLFELQVFEGASNRTCVFIMRKGKPQKYPVPYAYWRKKDTGRSASFGYDATLEAVIAKTERVEFSAEPVKLDDATSAWLTGRPKALKAIRKLLGSSDYQAHAGVYTGGANAVYWFDILKDHGDGTVTARNITEGAKRKLDSVQVRLEKELLYPQLRGRDVTRWQTAPTAHVLFVQDVKTRRGLDEDYLRDNFPLAYEWLESHKKILLERAAYRRYFQASGAPFYSMFDIGEYTLARHKVIWLGYGARRVNAAISGHQHGKPVCGNQAMHMSVACDTKPEAFYLSGCVNSSPFNAAVVMHTQIGGKSFAQSAVLETIRVPKFCPDNSAHKAIAEIVEALHKHLDDARLLREYESKLDDAVCRVWNLSSDELKAARQVCEELSRVDFDEQEVDNAESGEA